MICWFFSRAQIAHEAKQISNDAFLSGKVTIDLGNERQWLDWKRKKDI